jgi:transcriptional regulator
LTELHEGTRAEPWSVDDAPAKFVAGHLRAIVGIELAITRIEAKAKLSQNRSAADVDGVIAGLRADGDTQAAAAVERHR